MVFSSFGKQNKITYRDEIPQTLISTKQLKIDLDDLIGHALFNNIVNSCEESKGYRTVLFTSVI